VTTSTLFTSACGMVLTSTRPVTVEATERRPSSSTSVRGSPRLRRLSALMPACPLDRLRRELPGRVDPASAGIWFTKSAMLLDGEEFWISSWVSTVTGVGAWNPSRMMRVPVTITSAPPSPTEPGAGSPICAVAVLDGCVWAVAGLARPTASATSPDPPSIARDKKIPRMCRSPKS
jgi:hypothetical protein